MRTGNLCRLLTLLLAGLLWLAPATALAHPHLYSVRDRVEITPETLLAELRTVQVIFIGEFHDHVGHHAAQLSVIDALDNEATPLAIGLEMFRRDSQESLDVWTANKLPLLEFLPVYNDNWSMWPEYSKIFLHARNQGIKMVGLNIPRHLTRKVASSGFNSLSPNERRMLGNVQCEVDPIYGQYIRRAMGGFGGHGDIFLYFCEAQLLWDTMMARNLIDFLKENPDYRVVVLAGSGHSWKFGIPRQLEEQSDITYR
ncbi:MAG: ChaN family lipoprotein, partial [Desulfuromonadales bacterium]